MPTVQGPSKKGEVEKNALLLKMDRLFRISPAKAKAKDGSNEIITVEHRIGRSAGAYTQKDLMEKLGLEEEFKEYVLDMNKKLKDRERLKETTDSYYRALKSRLNKAVSGYRASLEKFYGSYPRALRPCFGFIPIDAKNDGLFLQGLRDEATLKPVVYDELKDVLTWVEVVFSKTRNWRLLNEEAEKTARAMMTLPGINKDLRYRAQAIAQGKVPERIGFEPEEK